VRYRLPYSYGEIYHRAKKHGVYLPKKAPREINIAYKGEKIMQLTKERDPELFKRVQKEHKTGSLEKMRRNYMNDVKKEITRKNQEYRMKNNDVRQPRSIEQNKQGERIRPRQTSTSKRKKQVPQYQTREKHSQKDSQSHIIRKKRKKSSEVENKRNEATHMKQEGKKRPVPQDYYKESPRNKDGKRRGEPRGRRMMSSSSSKYRE
jgi:hypothetical protein